MAPARRYEQRGASCRRPGLAPRCSSLAARRCYAAVGAGGVEAIVERFYAISVERRLKHPAVVAVSDAARKDLFG